MFDDEEPRISLLWVKDRLDPGESPDPAKSTRFDMQSDGSVVINVLDNHKLTLGADGKLTAELGSGTSLVVEENGASAKLTLGDGTKSVAVAEPLKTLYDALKTQLDLFDAHIHPTGMGPSGPPTPTISAPAFDDDIISSQMKLPETV
ncbi:hypothetical protein LCGC14_1019670 [marine sediment metagenome]|uniref:Uncharacterized protein n=1 Tax=marine sediment metagenome TaxID=412755 RepID=A0A0F9R3R7_9ZZZZ